MASDFRIAAVFSLMASACASGLQYGDEAPSYACGSESTGWIISEAPGNANLYRRLATENPAFKTDKVSAAEWGRHDEETWLTKPTGEVILCLADGPPWEAWGTTFWRFTAPELDSGEIRVADQGATIIIG